MIYETVFIENKWYIKVNTEEFGGIFLLNRELELPIPISFSTKEEALKYLRDNEL